MGLSDIDASPAPTAKPELFRRLDLGAILASEPPALDFVVPGLVARTVGLLVSPGGTGKSMWALEAAASVAAGQDLYGLFGDSPKRRGVLVVSAEDPEEVLQRRLHAVADHWRDYRDDILECLSISSVYGSGFKVGTNTPREGFVPSDHLDRLAEEIERSEAGLVILDTLNRMLSGIDENDNATMGLVVSAVERVLTKTNAACLILHHTNKAAAVNGQADQQQAVRGASALTDNARWQVNLVTMTPEEAKKRGVEDDERRTWVRSVHTKCNYASPMRETWLRRGPGGVLAQNEPPRVVEASKSKTSPSGPKKRRDVDDVEPEYVSDEQIPF